MIAEFKQKHGLDEERLALLSAKPSCLISATLSSQMPCDKDYQAFTGDVKSFSVLSLFVFAYICHQNIFLIFNELADNSMEQVNKVVYGAVGISAAVFLSVSYAGMRRCSFFCMAIGCSCDLPGEGGVA